MRFEQLGKSRKQTGVTITKSTSDPPVGVEPKPTLISRLKPLAELAKRESEQQRKKQSGSERPVQSSDPAGNAVQTPQVCADGYVRRSPVQALYTPPYYWKHMIGRAVCIALIVIALIVLLLLLYHSGLRLSV